MITGKITETPLTGLTSTLSDYDCADGNLQICHNFVNNGAGLQALQTAEKMKVEVDGEEVDINYTTFADDSGTLSGVTFKGLLFQHKTSNGINLIGVGKSTVNGAEKLYLYWYDKSNSKWRQLSDVGGDGEKTCTQVGNILIVNASNGLHYLVFKNFAYKYLGQSVPELDIDFSMNPALEPISNDDIATTNRLKDIQGFGIGRIHRMWIPVSASDWDDSAFGDANTWENNRSIIENGLFGGCNYIYTEVAKKNQFIHPFFVRYAIKMYDGTYTMHSAPIMMTPSDSDKIHVSIIHYGTDPNDRTILEKVDGVSYNSNKLFKGYLYGLFCYSPATLSMQVKNADAFDDWRDLIQEVSVFASPQISPYTATGKCNFTIHKDLGSTSAGKAISSYSTNYFKKKTDNDIEIAKSSYEILGISNYVSNGAGGYEIGTVENYNVAKVTLPTREGTQRDWIEDTANNFRLLRSYSLEELKDIQADHQSKTSEYDKWWWVKGEGSEGFKNLNTNEQLIDGYSPRRLYKPTVMHVYNSRLNMANCYIKERDNFLKNILGNRAIPDASAFGSSNKDVKVYIEEDGVWQVVSTTMKEICMSGYISYPNPNAKWIYVASPQDFSNDDSTGTYFKLKPHPYLFSAYHWSGDYLKRGSGVTNISLTDIPSAFVGEFNKHNYIYTTSVDNPFVVEAQGVNAVGNGDIISIQTTTQAMSEGTAFGAQPLSVFSTDGIYALQVNAVGLYDRAAPVSRETIKNGTDVLAIDNSVIFLSDRGLMQLNGSRTTLLSADLQAEHPTVIAHEGLPKWFDIHKKFFNEVQPHQYLEAYRFMDYIDNARLAFDYIHYRIYVYEPDEAVAFVYNIGTKTWSTCDSNFKSSVQGYPATIVNMAVNGNIVIGEFTQSGTDMVCDGKGLYLTRPIKFKENDILKTIRKVKERGIINSGNTKYLCLYGSDDMLNWELIAAKVGDEIPRLSGKPYKYFVVAGWSKLGYNRNVVSRLSIEMKEKYTNKIR